MTINTRGRVTGTTRHDRRHERRPGTTLGAITALARRGWGYNTAYAQAWQRYAHPGTDPRER